MGHYQHDYAAFGRLVLEAPWMVALMEGRVLRGLAVAESLSPVGDPQTDPHSGRYKESWETSAEVGVSADGTRRAIGTLRNTSPEAEFVEFGTKNNPARRVAGAAMEAMR